MTTLLVEDPALRDVLAPDEVARAYLTRLDRATTERVVVCLPGLGRRRRRALRRWLDALEVDPAADPEAHGWVPDAPDRWCRAVPDLV